MLVVIGVDSHFTLIGETVHKHLSLLETEAASRLTRPLLVRRSDPHLYCRFLPWNLWNQPCFNHRHHMCWNLPPGFPLYYTGTALPVWVWSNDMTTDVMTLKMYLCVCVWQAGIYWITLMDTFSSNWVLLIVALAEVIGFIYIYGSYNNFVFMWNRFQTVCCCYSLVSSTFLFLPLGFFLHSSMCSCCTRSE